MAAPPVVIAPGEDQRRYPGPDLFREAVVDLSTVLLVAAIGCAVFGYQLLKRYYERPPVVDPVAGTETWTVEEIEALRQGSEEVGTRLRRQVGIVATAGPGPDGVLRSPQGGVECVWWRMERIRHYVERVDGEWYDRTERVSHNWSRNAFTLSDETGTLVVRPADADIVGAPEVYTRQEEFEPGDNTTGVVYVEHALPVGTTIFAHGEAHDLDKNHVTIAKPLDGGPLILSTRPEYVLRGEATKQKTEAEATRWQGYGLITLAVALFILTYVF